MGVSFHRSHSMPCRKRTLEHSFHRLWTASLAHGAIKFIRFSFRSTYDLVSQLTQQSSLQYMQHTQRPTPLQVTLWHFERAKRSHLPIWLGICLLVWHCHRCVDFGLYIIIGSASVSHLFGTIFFLARLVCLAFLTQTMSTLLKRSNLYNNGLKVHALTYGPCKEKNSAKNCKSSIRSKYVRYGNELKQLCLIRIAWKLDIFGTLILCRVWVFDYSSSNQKPNKNYYDDIQHIREVKMDEPSSLTPKRAYIMFM